MKKLLTLAAGVALGTALLVGCEKKTVTTTTETETKTDAPAAMATPETTPMMMETTPATTPTPIP